MGAAAARREGDTAGERVGGEGGGENVQVPRRGREGKVAGRTGAGEEEGGAVLQEPDGDGRQGGHTER